MIPSSYQEASDHIEWAKEYSKKSRVFFEDLENSIYKDIFNTLSRELSSQNPRQLLWHIINNIHSTVLCICGKPVAWFRNGNCYRKTCSFKCSGTNRRLDKPVESPQEPWYKNEAKLQAAREKRRQRCFEKYGVYSHQLRSDVREKTQQTNLKKYGSISSASNNRVKNKRSQTWAEKYQPGSKDFKCLIEKRKTTNNKKYGTDWPMQHDEVKVKQHSTMQKRYGTNHALQNKSLNDKRKETNQRKYGVSEAAQLHHVREKIKDRFIQKYGFPNWITSTLNDHAKSVLLDKDKFYQELSNMTLNQAADYLQISLRTLLNYAAKYELRHIFSRVKITACEQKIKDLLDSVVGCQAYLQNSKSAISPYELDFFVPQNNLAIEINGLYWHSELGGGKRSRSYHITKWNLCKEKNITLLMFNDIDIQENSHLVESKIKRYLQVKSPVIGARKLTIEICNNYQLEQEFLNTWHLQGASSNRNLCLVAKYDNQIIGISTWKQRNNKAELVRFATNINYSFPGLLSKMIKRFIIETNFSGKIFTFSNNQYGNGNAYLASGFQFDGVTPPGYYYTNDYVKLESRLKFQKHKLADLFQLDHSVVQQQSEWEIMQSQGYDRVWDCGHSRYMLIV